MPVHENPGLGRMCARPCCQLGAKVSWNPEQKEKRGRPREGQGVPRLALESPLSFLTEGRGQGSSRLPALQQVGEARETASKALASSDND